MAHIVRKYDFHDGSVVWSSQIDEELDQLVAAHNAGSDVSVAMQALIDSYNLPTATHSATIKAFRINADNVIEITYDNVNWFATSSGTGHIIVDKSGAVVPQRSRIRFLNTEIQAYDTEIVVVGTPLTTSLAEPLAGKALDALAGAELETNKESKFVIPRLVTGAYTLIATDAGKLLNCTSATTITVTIPQSTLPLGSVVVINRDGDGRVAVTPASGVTLHSAGDKRAIKDQYGEATLVQIAANDWRLVGSLEV